MRRKYNLRKLVTKRSYDANELAETLGVHLQTIRQWHRDGLKALPDTKSPYLFLGSEVKTFLEAESAKYKVKLKDDEFYCVSCRGAVKPKPESVEIKEREHKLGNGNQAIYLQSKCPDCKAKIVRFGSSAESRRTSFETISVDEHPKKVNKKLNANQTMRDQRSLFDPDVG